jgi:hypothetical protein
LFSANKVMSVCRAIRGFGTVGLEKFPRPFGRKVEEAMLRIIAAVLIVLWLLGLFAFHVTSGFIHVALVVGIILLAIHFMRETSANA